jgi:hypothetical protein
MQQEGNTMRMTAEQFKMLMHLRSTIIEIMDADGYLIVPPKFHNRVTMTALRAVARSCADRSLGLSKQDFAEMAAEAFQDDADEDAA